LSFSALWKGPLGGLIATPVQHGRRWKCKWKTCCPLAGSLNC
jgi:hypothetical protein